jgi:O-antigen/teichoic acid export membrane protein
MNNKKAIMGSVWNLAGMLLPLFAGLYSIPQIIKLWGEHQAGLLMLIWGLIGYFSLFDFGLGRAVTQRMATHYKDRDADRAAKTAVTAVLILVLIGFLTGLILWFFEPAIGKNWLNNGGLANDEIAKAIHYVAIALPFVIVSVGMRGILEAQNRFVESNLIRLPLGIWTFVSPVIAANCGMGFSEMIFLLMFARAISMVIYFIMVRDVLIVGKWSRKEFNFLIKFGGWMTVSNTISPIMTQIDRYVIAYLVAATAVTYYVTPYEIVMRVQLIATAVTAAYLPLFASLQANREVGLNQAYQESNHLVYWPTLLAAGFLYFFAGEFLSRWISPEFSTQSQMLMRILSIGIIFNSQALVPYTLLQAVARPKWIAINHLIELPVYLLLLWFATTTYGLLGAAFTSTLRVICDYMILQWQGGLIVTMPNQKKWKSINGMILLGVIFIVGVDYWSGETLKIYMYSILLVVGFWRIYHQISAGNINKVVM